MKASNNPAKALALDMVRLASTLLTAVAVGAGVALEVTDQEAVPVGAVFLALVIAGTLSRIYRFAGIGAALLGSAAYGILEGNRGHDGLAAWAAATAGLAAVAIASRFLEWCAVDGERRLARTQEMVGELTMYDEASGLLKRRYGELALEEEVRRARRTNTMLSLVLLAADPPDDHPLETPPDDEQEAMLLGPLLQDTLRLTDRAARLTSVIFAAILPATSASGGSVVAEKLRALGERRGNRPVRCGVATFPDHAVSAQELLAEAETALHLARTANISVVNPIMLQSLTSVAAGAAIPAPRSAPG